MHPAAHNPSAIHSPIRTSPLHFTPLHAPCAALSRLQDCVRDARLTNLIAALPQVVRTNDLEDALMDLATKLDIDFIYEEVKSFQELQQVCIFQLTLYFICHSMSDVTLHFRCFQARV